jgi:branched-chain amino acid transport system substrate-binding protein
MTVLKDWIPAFAGMTKKRIVRPFTRSSKLIKFQISSTKQGGVKMKKTLCLTLILLFALGSLAFAQNTVKIGVVGPRTGPAAATGKAFEEGIAIALDHLNAKGGVMGKKVEVVFEDTGGVPEKAASALERLATREKVPIVVGESHSSSALAEIEVANRYKIPLIICEAWHDDITKKGYKWVFRAGPANSGVVDFYIAPFVKENGFKKAASSGRTPTGAPALPSGRR